MKIGTDILYIPRLESTIKRTPSFIKKVYTQKEIEFATGLKEPLNFYATRFAAKEAIMKASNLKYDFDEIEVLSSEDGSPRARILCDSKIDLELSISFDRDYVIAVCLIK